MTARSVVTALVLTVAMFGGLMQQASWVMDAEVSLGKTSVQETVRDSNVEREVLESPEVLMEQEAEEENTETIVPSEQESRPAKAVKNCSSGHVFGSIRFVFLTDWAVRVEYSPSAEFEDRDTLIFSDRQAFLKDSELDINVEQDETGSQVTLRTKRLLVTYGSDEHPYSSNPPPSNTTLNISFRRNDEWLLWNHGDENDGNLFGTVRTLDMVNGSCPLEKGLLSRDGWTVVDDTKSPILLPPNGSTEIRWSEQRANSEGGYNDIYFFGYGFGYREMMNLYVGVTGRVPIPPRFSLGVWWSRWWPYSDQELKELVQAFEEHSVPLDVLVIDMDWHLTAYERMNAGYLDLSGQPLGWTGYTWNSTLFPEPDSFLAWCHDRGLRTTLNLHPAGGIQPWEKHFPQIADHMGVDPDPAEKKHVPFEIADKKFAYAWFDYVLRPLEKQGIDFWWLDWQQYNYTSIPNLNPTIWLNHVFFSDMERRRAEAIPDAKDLRGLIFHRWGGLGSHRYQVGFSGDVITSWESLRFQIYFTLTAANVAFGHWSHDIGGFLSRTETPPELFTRWVQWGSVSAVFRTHAWRKDYLERRIWKYPSPYFEVMREYLRFRLSLAPFLYGLNRVFHDTGVAAIYPMYYDYPEDKNAYAYKTQFFLGQDVIVSPATRSLGEETQMDKPTYLPPGNWIAWHSGEKMRGGLPHNAKITLEDLPFYVRAGTAIPMSFPGERMDSTKEDPLILSIFPGSESFESSSTVYQDDGVTTAYKNGEGNFATTTVLTKCSIEYGHCEVEVQPVVGSFANMPSSRAYILRFVFLAPPSRVSVNGKVYSRQVWDAEEPEEETTKSLMDIGMEWTMHRGEKLGGDAAGQDGTWTYDPFRFTAEILVPTRKMSEGFEVKLEWDDEDSLIDSQTLLHTGVFGRLRRLGKMIKSGAVKSLHNGEEIVLQTVIEMSRVQRVSAASSKTVRLALRLLAEIA